MIQLWSKSNPQTRNESLSVWKRVEELGDFLDLLRIRPIIETQYGEVAQLARAEDS